MVSHESWLFCSKSFSINLKTNLTPLKITPRAKSMSRIKNFRTRSFTLWTIIILNYPISFINNFLYFLIYRATIVFFSYELFVESVVDYLYFSFADNAGFFSAVEIFASKKVFLRILLEKFTILTKRACS